MRTQNQPQSTEQNRVSQRNLRLTACYISGDSAAKPLTQNPESGAAGAQQSAQAKADDDISSFTDEAEEKGQVANATPGANQAPKSSQPAAAAKVSHHICS